MLQSRKRPTIKWKLPKQVMADEKAVASQSRTATTCWCGNTDGGFSTHSVCMHLTYRALNYAMAQYLQHKCIGLVLMSAYADEYFVCQ